MKTLTSLPSTHRAQPFLSLIKRYARFLSRELEEEVSPQRAILITVACILFCCAAIAAIVLHIIPFIILMTACVITAHYAGMFPEWQPSDNH